MNTAPIASFLQKQPKPVVIGATGRIGQLLQRHWGQDAAHWYGRRIGPLQAAQTILCLSGGGRLGADANVEAPRRLLEAAAQAGAARVFLMSSQAVYGRGAAGWSEDSPGAPVQDYGRLKQQMEALPAPDGLDVVVLRLGNVAGCDALLGQLLPQKKPVLDTFPDGTTPQRSYIGPATLARVLAHLMAHPGPLPARINLAAPGAIEMADLLRAAGRSWTPHPAPPEALASVVIETGIIESIFPFTPADSTAKDMVRQWQEDRAT